MNTTPRGERTHIALFGRRNVGKSSLINALTGQQISIVSEVKGTTTDPVYKAMELLPLGPVVLIDTPGLDDGGLLGALRVERTREVLHKTDLALLVLEPQQVLEPCEIEMAHQFDAKKIPWLIVINKCDAQGVNPELAAQLAQLTKAAVYEVSCSSGLGVTELRAALAKVVPSAPGERRLVADLLKAGDVVVLVTPIDAAAPKGRLILPQQQTIREIIEVGASAVVTQVVGLAQVLVGLVQPPRLVITDSQVFKEVAAVVPAEVPLTSFSMLFAHYKGDLAVMVQGAQAVTGLKNGDRILIAESCTHHQQSDDIGTVKIPRWLREKSGLELIFEHSSGIAYPDNLAKYALIVHCGGCMLNQREMLHRIEQAKGAGVPVVNYGILIAYLQGILPRCLAPFGVWGA